MEGALRAIASRAVSAISTLTVSRSPSSPRAALISRIIRVDHSGELGADSIYAGQMAVLKNTPSSACIQKMWDEEKGHLDEMERQAARHDVPLSAFSPLFSVAGFVLGATSATAGKEGAMGCTMAVEELIASHYNNQIKEILEKAPEEKELLHTLTKLRDDEQHHFDIGKENEGEKSPLFEPLKKVVQGGCRAAIFIAERV